MERQRVRVVNWLESALTTSSVSQKSSSQHSLSGELLLTDTLVAASNQASPRRDILGRWILILLLCWLSGIMVVVALMSQTIRQDVLTELERESDQIADELGRQLQQYEGIASAVADLRTLRETLRNPTVEQVTTLNRFLERTNVSLGSNSLFVLDPEGNAIGSSNHNDKDSFVGHDFSFRPYFTQAILGEPGKYYAVGVVSGWRGYYFSAPIFSSGEVLGVVVIKILLEPVFQRLRDEGAEYLIVGYDGVVFASSQPDWALNSLQALPESRRQAIRGSRRYGNSSITPVGDNSELDVMSSEQIYLSLEGIGHAYLVGRSLVPQGGWHVLSVSPVSVVFKRTLHFCVYFSLAFGVLMLIGLYWRKHLEVERHVIEMNHELERRVTGLTAELRESNTELQQLVAHYQRAQTELEATQDQLVQAAKLAVLGEMSAGINHELNQPLLALQTYAENSLKLSQRERHDMVAENLGEIVQIVQSMHIIVSRLKVFARRTPPEPRAMRVSEVLDGAMAIMTPLLHRKRIDIQVFPGESGLTILCEPVQVQQVLINLITNAADALSDHEVGLIRVEVCASEDEVSIAVRDNGPGIAPEIQGKIFEPFFTTKARGLGIGLALSRRIIETLSGTLKVDDGVDGGTAFILTLPRLGEAGVSND